MSSSLLIAGLPGKMAAECVLVVQESPEEFSLLPYGLTGPGLEGSETVGNQTYELVAPDKRDQLNIPEDTIAIDFTTPDAALDNVDFYCAKKIPFVMGTTGYDMDEAVRLVQSANIPAVIAPNMAVPIVILQSALARIAEEYPAALSGYDISIKESHQSGKLDTSGTAKALVNSFQKLGLPAQVEEINKVRDPEVQRTDLGVPEEHIAGHAYHFYRIVSESAGVELGLSHCVHGRRVYAEGAYTAVKFLKNTLYNGTSPRIYSMQDVLRNQTKR